jgi:hypothetical protein
MPYRFAPLNLFICDMSSCKAELRLVNPEPLKAIFSAIDKGWTIEQDIILCPDCSPPETTEAKS